MRLRVPAIGALLAFVLSVPGSVSPQERTGFFDLPPDETGNYDRDAVYPTGQIFPISLYSLLPADMPAVREASTPITGPYYGGLTAANLLAQDTATALGLRFIHQIEPANVTFLDSNPNRLTALDDTRKAEIRSQIRQQMVSTLNVPARNANLYAWSVTPEELRPWRAIEMAYLSFVASTIRSTDAEYGNVPRPVLLYNPNNRLASQLMTLGEHLGILLRGAYVNSWPAAGAPTQEAVQPRPWIRWATDSIVTASQSLPHRPVPFVALEMSQDPPNATDRHPDTITRWVRHSAYLALARGARGIFVWSGWRNRATLRQTFDYWFDGYRTVSADLNGALQLGKVFLFGQRRNDVSVAIVSGPATVSYRGSDDVPQTDPSVTFADIAYSDGRYLIAVNSAAVPVTARFDGFPDVAINSVRLFDMSIERVQSSLHHTFQPYEAVAWRFTAE